MYPHWIAITFQKKCFLMYTWFQDKVITDENGIYSSSGMAPLTWTLFCTSLKKICRKGCSRFYKHFKWTLSAEKPIARFVIFSGTKEHEDEAIKKRKGYWKIWKRLNNRLTNTFAIGLKETLSAIWKLHFNTVVEYMRRCKNEAAKMGFQESSRENVNGSNVMLAIMAFKAFRVQRLIGLSYQQNIE